MTPLQINKGLQKCLYLLQSSLIDLDLSFAFLGFEASSVSNFVQWISNIIIILLIFRCFEYILKVLNVNLFAQVSQGMLQEIEVSLKSPKESKLVFPLYLMFSFSHALFLQNNQTLISLDLRSNEISECEFLESLCHFSRNYVLYNLFILDGSNEFTANGVSKIIQYIFTNGMILQLPSTKFKSIIESFKTKDEVYHFPFKVSNAFSMLCLTP